jgi:hypothetical protein
MLLTATTAATNVKKNLVTRKLDLNLRKTLLKSDVWSIDFYGAENCTLRNVDQKYLESLKCGVGEGRRRSVGPKNGKCYKESSRKGISYIQ